MTANEQPEGLHFSPDFAARVLAKAGAISARRRQTWRAAAAAAGVLLLGIGSWLALPQRKPSGALSRSIASAETASSAQGARAGPLDYLFPDAAPLAQFASDYSAAMNGNAANRNDALFAGSAAEDEPG